MFHFIKIIKSGFYQIYKDIYFSINFVCKMRKYSVIIPAYNRPDEVGELLESLKSQPFMDFEIIVVEDGSTLTCRDVVIAAGGVDADAVPGTDANIRYYYKPNSGPGQTRNYGAARSRGEYLLILDSDVIVPKGYFASIERELSRLRCDAFGGPDRAADNFTPVQKAISYAMTSFFTTGGIRGGRQRMDRFYPRSFNMGIRRDVFNNLGGFSKMRFGEDIDLSIRIFEAGYSCRLFPDSWVYHKRRTDFRKFYRQVYNSGIARINLYRRHPGSLKIVHFLPAAFTVGVILLILLSPLTLLSLVPIAVYALMVFADASAKNGSFRIGGLSVCAAFVQLSGYGFGFISAWWRRCVLGRGEFDAFRNTFYK